MTAEPMRRPLERALDWIGRADGVTDVTPPG